MLESLGFKDIIFDSNSPNKIVSANKSYMEGYVLANSVDVYGRVIAFVYLGGSTIEDSTKVFINESMLKNSVNFKLLAEGLVYPTFYASLPIELVQYFSSETKEVRKEKRGLWAEEHINIEKSIKVNNIDDLEILIAWPKLFRRLAEFFKRKYKCIDDFLPWLHDNVKGYDDEVIFPNLEKGNLHDMIAIDNGEIKMLYLPEDVIIIDKEKK